MAAYESDLQITGGVNADIDVSGGTVVGGSATVADIKNNVNASIKGGTYSNVNNANVKTLLATKQITAAVSAGVAVGKNSQDSSGSDTGSDTGSGTGTTGEGTGTTGEGTGTTGEGTGTTGEGTGTTGEGTGTTGGDSGGEGSGSEGGASSEGGTSSEGAGSGTPSEGSNAILSAANDLSDAAGAGAGSGAAAGTGTAGETGEESGSSNKAFSGAVVYNGITNNSTASISGANITADGSVAVLSHDTSASSEEAKPFQDKLGDYKKNEAFAEKRGLDIDGSSYYKDGNGLDTAGETVDTEDKGSLSVGAAMVIAGSNGTAGGAAVNVGDRDVDFAALIDNSTIRANSITAGAEADTLNVDVSAGIAATSGDYGGVGSVNWATQHNDVLAQVLDSTLTTDALSITANSSAKAVNVAGSVAYGKTAGIGAALAYNKLANQIHAYLAGGTVNNISMGGTDLVLSASNTGKLYAIGASVGASQKVAFAGTSAANHGGSDTEAVIGEAENEEGTVVAKDKTTLTRVKKVSVNAASSDYRLAVVGNVSGSKKVALGGAIVYNDVGGAGTSEESAQKTRAALVNTNMTMAGTDTASVHAEDTSTLTTIGVGAGGSGGVAVQGAAASALVNKSITAELKNSSVLNATDSTIGGNVDVTADSKSKIVTTAVAAAVSKDFAGGAGVAVNRIRQDTTASATGGKIRAKNVTIEATGNSSITTVGIGAGVAVGTAGVAGNIAVNLTGNTVKAEASDTNIESIGNIAVLANGRENLGNYAGAFGVATGGESVGAGIGVGFSYNEITGSTEANVKNSRLTAKGNQDTTVDLTQAMDVNGIKTEVTKDGNTVSDKRKGVVVASYGQHDLQSVALTAGVGISGSGTAVGAAGTVTVNKIGGATKAVVNDTAINETRRNNQIDDVTVKAVDKTDSESHVGSLSLGIGGGTGVGVAAASDTLVFDRTTRAELSGTAVKPTVNGRMIDVTAEQSSDVVTNADGVAVTAGSSGASVAATAAATKLSGSTEAVVKNIKSTSNGLNISASHAHKTTLVSASAGAAISTGAAAGVGIGVTNDDFTTSALLDNSTITAEEDVDREDTGNVSVKADSNTTVKTYVAGVAGSGGIAAGATVSVNNLDSKTTAGTNNSTITAGSAFTNDAHNELHTDFNSLQASLSIGNAAIGVGAGINTIDTGTLSKVTGSQITAKTADIKSREEIDVNQMMEGATIGGFGINANVMVTTIGTEAANTYGSSDNNGASADVQALIDKANGAMDDQDGNAESAKSLISEDNGVDPVYKAGVFAGKGTNTGGGTQVSMKNTIISEKDKGEGVISVSADRKTDATLDSAAITVSGKMGASATVTVLDADKDAGITIDHSVLSAGKDISITARQHGKTEVNSYQAGISLGGALSAALAFNRSAGSTNIGITGSAINHYGPGFTESASGNTTILAEDTGITKTNTYGLEGALLVSGGVMLSDTKNDSSTKVSIDTTRITSPGTTSIKADKSNTTSAYALGGAVGALTMQGTIAEAKDLGDSTVVLTGANTIKGGESLAIEAKSAPRAEAEARSYAGSLLGAGASVANASASGRTNVTAADGSSFAGKKVNISAYLDQQPDGKSFHDNVSALAVGVSGNIGGFSGNLADARETSDIGVSIGESKYDTDSLIISGTNQARIHGDSTGVNAGITTGGLNDTTVKGTLTTSVTASGMKSGSRLGTVSIEGSTKGILDGSADGTGAGIANISPVAAKLTTWLTQNTDTNVKGNWSADAFSAKSANKEDANLSVNSLGAAVVNASGSEMTTNISHTAKTNVTGSIETDGRQSYYADNTADEEVNLRGSGYGGLSRTANEMDNTLSYTAGVNMDKAALSANGAKGSIDVLAMTGGEMAYLNQTKSAGVGPSTNSTTTSHVTYDNSITAKDSTLKTAKENQNITMASVDVTRAAFKTVADTQGGIAGAASGSTDSTLDRSNKISISGGLIESMNDVNLYAGASLNRYESSLNYELSAEAYNRTVIPLWTDPKVTNSMTQKNQLLIDGGVRSVRHTNLYAEKGVTTVTETAREYKLYTKDGGEGEVASTAHGDRIKNEVEDNYIDLSANGSILAGIHTDLDLAISGGTSYTDNGAGIAPTLHTDGVEVTVSKGADWFDKDSVEIGTVTLTNPFYERYMNLLRQMGEYPVESNEHKNLKAGAEMLAAMMESGGYTRNGRILGEVEIASASIPDIIISGGNINIDADKVQGTGSLTARSANSATISNASDLYMKTGKIVLKESGGEIRRDGVSVKSKDELAGFTGTMESSSLIDIAPSVTIQSTGVGKDVSMTDDKGVSHTVRITRPDIGVFGNIENARGKITIRNNNENVYVDSKANVTGKTIEISAEKGAVTQATSGWNVVGSDPILRYRFSEDIAKKIQTYLNDNAEAIAKGTKDVSWLTKASTYEEFLDTLLNGYHWEGALSTIHISNANALKLTTEELDEIRKAKSDYEADDGAGVHAGENVYLTAKNVIIDGLIQSGYNKYETVLDSTESLNRTSAIKSLWQGNGSPELTNDRVLGDKEYLVNEGGGAHYNTETRVWEYAPRIYYNPSTNNYVTENIEPVGGKIYIAGNVASTNGKGRILAMDGKGDIHIDTTAAGEGSTLILNTVKNQDVDGLISIRDPAANMRTEIRMGDNGITYDYTPIDGDADSAERIAANGDGSLTYNPMNQRLIWTGGSSGGTTHETKQYKEDFVFWGGITYNTTDEFVAKADETGNVISIGSVKVDGNPAESGQVIINASEPQTNDYEVTTSYYQGAKHIGPEVVERHYKSKFFGIGTRTHTWEESYETAKSSTYSINANKPITIDFLKSGNGSISVASAGNIKLEGNVSSASSTGTVTLSSTKGSIEGGTHGVITTDHLTARGESDVFLDHAAAGTDATIDITSASGDISILSDQGNLHVNNASALNGTVNIHADDSIQTNEGKKIEGQRIDLTSDHGSITALANAASEADDYNSLWANLNAQADGDITLRNDNGNMRIGRIVSKSGDVVLTTSGSFEEAANNVDISSSEDKVKQWKELGLINAGDAAGSREKSAEAAKADRQAILDARGTQLAQASSHTAEEYKAAASAYAKAFAESTDMQEAQDTYEKIVKANPDNELALQNAYEDYTNKKKAFLAELGYTGYTEEEENLIFDSAELISSTSYGWSQNDLLYAIQDSILNASPRNEVVTAEEANIEGRNITLRAAENIGTDDAPVEMSYDSLSNEDNLQILSKAKAGDLTWDDEKNILTVRQQRPITIKASGTVDISANPDGTSSTGNIYLAGVKNTQLNISGNIDTNADVKLMSDNGVQMESGTITARNLIITGGNGDIGSEEKNILTNISGSLDARTEKNLYLHQMALGGNEARVLMLQNAGASGVYLTSDAGIAMTTETGKTMGYIDGDRIYLTSKDGAIGKEGDGIRIRNNGALLSAHAETDGQGIYLSGKESKSLILSEVTAGGDFKIESEGTVDAGVLADEETGTSAVSSAITADNVSFKTLGAVHLVNGTIETAETGDTSLEASGEITQTTSNTIQSGSLTVKASGGVDMQTNKSGTANKFGTINLTALAADKDVLIENAHDTETTVNIAEGTTTNSITVTNNSTSDSSNVIIHGEGTAETYINIDNGKGTIKTDSNLTANGGNITLTAKDGITNEGAIAAKEGVSMASDSGIITNKGAVSASAGSVSMTTTGAIINKGTVTAQAPAKQSKMKRFFFSANDISNEEVPAPVESTKHHRSYRRGRHHTGRHPACFRRRPCLFQHGRYQADRP